MLKAKYLGTFKASKFQHLDDNELLVTAYPYRSSQNVLNELVANAVIGDSFPYTNREIEAVLTQVVNEIPEYNTFTEKDDTQNCTSRSFRQTLATVLKTYKFGLVG